MAAGGIWSAGVGGLAQSSFSNFSAFRAATLLDSFEKSTIRLSAGYVASSTTRNPSSFQHLDAPSGRVGNQVGCRSRVDQPLVATPEDIVRPGGGELVKHGHGLHDGRQQGASPIADYEADSGVVGGPLVCAHNVSGCCPRFSRWMLPAAPPMSTATSST